jgi:hypothetical protein
MFSFNGLNKTLLRRNILSKRENSAVAAAPHERRLPVSDSSFQRSFRPVIATST